MPMGPLFWLIIAIVIISTVVGAVAKLLNSMNEMNNAPPQSTGRPRLAATGAAGSCVNPAPDMDRFLAEIDRLRRKNADAPQHQRGETVPVAPVVQPAKQPDRPRARVVAELAEAQTAPNGYRVRATHRSDGPGRDHRPQGGRSSHGNGRHSSERHRRAADQGHAPVLRPRIAPKTPFAKNLTTLLGSGQGLVLAIVLSEVLGPPKSRKA